MASRSNENNRNFKIKQRGAAGEKYVCEYLVKHGYEIVESNCHSRYGETDIIARKGDILAFVEVKTRTVASKAHGFESITPTKVNKMIKTAADYIEKNGVTQQPRIDCASVIVDGKTNRLVAISYIENAVEQVGDGYSPY